MLHGKFGEFFLSLFKKFKNYLYRCYLKNKLFKLGRGSFVAYPAKLINPEKISIGNNVFISEYSWLNCGGARITKTPSLFIHNSSYIGRMSQINAWEEVIIEENVLIADRVLITDADHNYKDKSLPIIQQGDKFIGKIHIKSGAWIGINAVILPNVKIGVNSVVAANCVVNKDVPDNSIAVGVPAKILKKWEEYKNIHKNVGQHNAQMNTLKKL